MRTGGSYDVAVVGVGAMGAAACAAIAARGARVLGLERFSIAHELGSSGGDTRLFRTAYFEHPDYLPLLVRAREGWASLEAATGRTVFHETGVLYAGRPDGELIRNTEASARAYDVRIEDVGDVSRRFPMFRFPADFRVLLEPEGGLVLSLRAIGAFAGAARARGATLREGTRVLRWAEEPDRIVVETDAGTYAAGHLVLAPGAWTVDLVPELADRLRVTRQVLGWVRPDAPAAFAPPAFPSWAIEDGRDGLYYGFPYIADASPDPDRQGLKVGRHAPGPVARPDAIDRVPGPADEGDFRPGVERYLPSAAGPTLCVHVCMYTNTPDGHFLVGPLPGHARVSIAAGFCGHGFKFAPVIGEALADLTLEGRTGLPIGFLDPGRDFTTFDDG